MKRSLRCNSILHTIRFLPFLQPFLYLFREAHEPPGEEDDGEDEDDADNNIPAERETCCLEPFPDDSEDDSADDRAGQGAKAAKNNVRDRPEGIVNPVQFRRDVTDVVDLERPGNTGNIRGEGECEEPVPDRVDPCSPGFEFVLPDCEKCKTD